MIPTFKNDRIVSDHLVLFIHGMGQQYEKYGNMKHHVSTMQKNTTNLLKSHYPNQNIRVKYIPIEWHSDIHGVVDTQMSKATLSTVPKVRMTTNEWLMDCLYYFSKPYGQYIINSVCKKCDLAYIQHQLEYPDFEGHVHLIGFSLGGIIGYDIATMQWSKQDGRPPWKNAKCQMPDLIVPQLKFKVRCLFTCGSPIAAGLICRGLDYMHYRPPLRTKVYNIFHPFDPLGYRLEPMINDEYERIEPVQINRLKRLPKIPNLGIRSSIAVAKPFFQSFWHYVSSTVVSTSNKSSFVDDPSTPTTEEYEEEIVQELLIGMKRKGKQDDVLTPLGNKRRRVGDQSDTDNELEDDVSISNNHLIIEGKDGQCYPRTDYVLSENMIDAYASEWIVALKSHFRYWANRDLTLHIVKVFVNDE